MGFSAEEMKERFERGSHRYRGYEIRAKRDYTDFLQYDRGFYLRDGFVVTKGIVNVMPGAVWFQTVDAARNAIDILEAVGPERFWDTHERIKQATEQTRMAVLTEAADAAVNA